MTSIRAKFLIGLTILTVSCIGTQRAFGAGQNCSPFQAVYTPSDDSPVQYDYFLSIEQAPHPHPGYTSAFFILNTFGDDYRHPLSTLRLAYACDGEGNRCQTGYSSELASPNGSVYKPSFLVEGLDKNFRRVTIADPAGEAPYAIVMPDAAAVMSRTNWKQKQKDIVYFTPDKVSPRGYDVWIFDHCNTKTEKDPTR